jgi:hypothetical protein
MNQRVLAVKVVQKVSFAAVLVAAGSVYAATVRGTLTVPPEPRPDARDGRWRVENGVLPIAPRSPDPRTEAVVVLEPQGGAAAKPSTNPVTVELHGLRADPRVAVAAPGTPIVIKNGDRVPHTIAISRGALAPTAIPAGQSQKLTIPVAGDYALSDEDWPHLDGTLLVTAAFSTTPDERGSWKLEVPEGKYTLRVFFRGGWAHSQPLEVSGKTTEISVTLPGAQPSTTPPARAAAPQPPQAQGGAR